MRKAHLCADGLGGRATTRKSRQMTPKGARSSSMDDSMLATPSDLCFAAMQGTGQGTHQKARARLYVSVVWVMFVWAMVLVGDCMGKRVRER